MSQSQIHKFCKIWSMLNLLVNFNVVTAKYRLTEIIKENPEIVRDTEQKIVEWES